VPAGPDPPRAPDPAPALAAAAPAGPASVVIEQIQVITPPGRAPEADPFASLAAARAGGAR
jgi:hypothetical protein